MNVAYRELSLDYVDTEGYLKYMMIIRECPP